MRTVLTRANITAVLGVCLVVGCTDPGDAGVADAGENTSAGDACTTKACQPVPGASADEVVEAPGDTGEGTGDAENAVNGVRGCGMGCGSLDVFSLGYDAGVDNFVTLRWSGRRVVNGPGVDFVVFENAFAVGDGAVFLDAVIVYLSRDGQTWVPFPHDYQADDETVFEPDPSLWPGFAGVHPVLFHEEDNRVNPFDTELAGGDPFDLSDLPDDGGEAEAIKREGFRYLKLVTAPSQVNPDTGDLYVKEGISDGADIDGVYARYFEAP